MRNSSRPDESGLRLKSRPLVAGAALMGLGGLLGLAGIVISGSALAAAMRGWARQQEVPPSELAKLKWAQAKAAAGAGASAWRNGTQAPAGRS